MTQTQARREQLWDSLVSRAEANDVNILIHSNVKLTVCKRGLKPTHRRRGTVSQGTGSVKVQGVMLSK